ncbi:MAG: SDR family oxidoreductase [Rhodospirillaceae bacterium]|nr:SDR family oxidoreductase [Rhodospirillaceae bacterium]
MGEDGTLGDLQDKVCVVIGGGSIAPGWGIGKAIAVSYARQGAKVAVADANLAAAQETADLVSAEGAGAIAVGADCTDEAAIRALIDRTMAQFGRIDVLHNNVGIGKAGDPEATTPDDWRRIADANITALHISALAALPHMKAQRSGVILTTSTIAAIRHIGYSHLPYGVTKAAAIQFSRLMAIEYASYGIRANTIVVGIMDTPRVRVTLTGAYGGDEEAMLARRHRQPPLGTMGNAWDIANAAVFLASDKARYITGTELVVDGGLTATTRM